MIKLTLPLSSFETGRTIGIDADSEYFIQKNTPLIPVLTQGSGYYPAPPLRYSIRYWYMRGQDVCRVGPSVTHTLWQQCKAHQGCEQVLHNRLATLYVKLPEPVPRNEAQMVGFLIAGEKLHKTINLLTATELLMSQEFSDWAEDQEKKLAAVPLFSLKERQLMEQIIRSNFTVIL